MTEPSSEDQAEREMQEIFDLGEQVLNAFKSVDDEELLRKGLERISK